MSDFTEELIQAPHQRRNWPFYLGLFFVLVIAALAVFGPSMAPKDPLEEHNIIRINGKWDIPPFPLFTKGYPLGSDMFGRDLYSRLLWAIRPTMIMVSIVAVVRLVMGVVIGLLAGWSKGRFGRWLDMTIEASLSVPVLLIALGAIAVVGVELGIWAFIVGLSLTGWVETAQQVREQTRIVRGQIYVEAAQALGAANRQILVEHILRQILPMMAMLFAFEVSSTLMTTAGLGFLGYYIGGDVWIEVGDFVSRRVSGMPELGQMLATSWSTLTAPWAMVATGSTVFVAVLGFNLLGEGFRQSLSLNVVRRRSFLTTVSQRTRFWLDQHVGYPLSVFFGKRAVRLAMVGALTLVVVGAGGVRLSQWWQSQAARNIISQIMPASPTPITATTIPQTEAASTPVAMTYSPQIAWQFEDESGFSGEAVLSADGKMLYAVSNNGTLYAFDLAGELIWQTQLPDEAVGTPLVGRDGTIYVSDKAGGLSALDPQRGLLWRFQSTTASKSASGPAISPAGALYYTITDGGTGYVQAVSQEGENLWAAQSKVASFYRTPTVSADGRYVFLKEDIFDAQSGERLQLDSDVNVWSFLPGEDGKRYLLAGNTIIQWSLEGDKIQSDLVIHPTHKISEIVAPTEWGVTADGITWKMYTSPGGDTSFYWVGLDGTAIGKTRYTFSSARMLHMASDLTTYVCGSAAFDNRDAVCEVSKPGASRPLWTLWLEGHGNVIGGFWKEGYLYLTTTNGMLYAIVEAESPVSEIAQGEPPPTQPAQPEGAGVVWSVLLPEEVLIGPLLAPDGTLYALSLKNVLYIISADGVLQKSVQLKSGLFMMHDRWGGGYSLWPIILPNGALVVFSDQNTVYAIDAAGNELWEFSLEAGPHSHPAQIEGGNFYLMDEIGGLYAFDADGLRWHFQTEAAQYVANGLAVAPDGTVYYVVTNRGEGFVQAVSPSGEGLWVSKAKTSSFYDDLKISSDGSLLFLKEDVFDARTGNLYAYTMPFYVNEFIPGEDGHLYLRSEHTIVEWQIGAQGFEVVQVADWGAPSSGGSSPYFAIVNANRVIWLGYRSQIVWLKPDGTVLSVHHFTNDAMISIDNQRTRFSECRIFLSDKALECKAYSPESEDPLWQVTIENVTASEIRAIRDGYVYMLSNQKNEIYKIFLGEH